MNFSLKALFNKGIHAHSLPKFPKFKKLELSDRGLIEDITREHPPYSDFNFTSMWAWNIKNETKISCLNGNLVVKFNDYLTGKPFYSFLGDWEVNDTVEKLLELSEKEKIEPVLKLVSEEAVRSLDRELFDIQEDRDNFDYVLSVEKLLAHDGTSRPLSTRRRVINKFRQANNIKPERINIHDKAVQKQLFDVFTEWEAEIGVNTDDSKHLKLALAKLFLMKEFRLPFSFGVYMDGKLVGYSVNEVISGGYAVGHFQQADLKPFSGMYALLMQEVAPYLHFAGCKYINIEQDLGMEGLKKWKQSYQPAFFLKKYIVSRKRAT